MAGITLVCLKMGHAAQMAIFIHTHTITHIYICIYIHIYVHINREHDGSPVDLGAPNVQTNPNHIVGYCSYCSCIP